MRYWPLAKNAVILSSLKQSTAAAATADFLLLGAEPMLEKLDRIKTKYGLAE